MTTSRTRDWDPRSDSVLEDQCAAYDEMRRRCPVAYSDFLQWSVFRHDDVVRVVEDHETFSNAISKHLSVPHGMDPPEHAEYRRVIEPFFTHDRMHMFEPVCRRIAVSLLEPLASRGTIDFIETFALPFALQAQSASLGWPDELNEPIRAWTKKNQEATLAGDRAAQTDIAREFTSYIDALLQARRRGAPQDDVTASLMQARVNGRPLTDDEIASVLRNWTVGEVTSLSSAIGILAQYLAVNRALQDRLRVEPSSIPLAIDEILRVCGPLVANQRVATRDVEIRGRHIKAGERVSLMWLSANRDERVFDNPEEVRLDRDPELNLVYGKGIHVCPGAPLARLEMRVALEELLARTHLIELPPSKRCRNAVYPANGFASLDLTLLVDRAGDLAASSA